MARGSIIKRKSERTGKTSYQVRVELPPDPVTGKRRQGSETFRTRELAQKRLNAWLQEIEQGTAVAPDKITVKLLLTDWLEKVARHKVRPTSLQSYRFTIEHYLIPQLGHVPVQKLTKAHLQNLNSTLFDQGKKERTIQLCHMRLSQALDWGVEMGYLGRNVCHGFKDRPVPKKRKPTIWTPEQVEQFLDAAGDWRPLFETMIFTGIRRGEALGLRWEDFDAKKGTLRIERSLVQVVGQPPTFQDTKTESGRRTISLPLEGVDVLKRHQLAQKKERMRLGPVWKDQGLIFPNDFGGPIFPDNLRRVFIRIIKKAGVPQIRIHDLRHTHGSLLLLNKVPLQTVSERLGHSRPSTTSDLYAHTLANSQDEAAAVMDALLGQKRESKRGA